MTAADTITIALCAGEASGDALGAELITDMRRRLPQARFYGIGGARMAAAGMDITADYQPLAVMGYWDALLSLPGILRLRRRFLQRAAAAPPDIFIGIDAPDFNLPLARALRGRGCRCVQYVAPSVWMWRQRRLKKIAAATDAVLCLLPFEKKLYEDAGIRAYYVGHPAARRRLPPRAAARQRLDISPDTELIALLPGSRAGELARHLPLLSAAATRLAHPRRRFAAAAASADTEARLRRALPSATIAPLDDVLAAADIAIVKSGTIALEAAMAEVPLLVFYRLSWAAEWLARWRRFRLPFFSLPNILSRRFVAAELLLAEATADNIVRESERLLQDADRRQGQRRQFAAVRSTLAVADVTPAKAITDTMANSDS